jgi:hypothetical protein
MQRAGHHAVLNWLAGHYSNCTLYNDFTCENRIEYMTGTGTGNCAFLTVEDYTIANSQKIIDSHNGTRKHIILLVLRDPYNLFASRLSARFTVRSGAVSNDAITLWKDHARAFLHQTFVPISFNEWFINQDYRKSIADFFGYDYNESKLKEVPEFGYGSSFDSCDLNGKADKMKVLERWKTCLNDSKYLEAIQDTDLTTLSTKIFGPICLL